MTKQELLKKIESFDDASDVVFITDLRDLLTLDSDGIDISEVIEVNNGEQTVIALMR